MENRDFFFREDVICQISVVNISLGWFGCIELGKSKQVIQLSQVLQPTQVFTAFGFSEEFLLLLNQPLSC